MKSLTIIVPCFNEYDSLPLFYQEISTVMKSLSNDITYDYLFIDDGSSDQTLDRLKEMRSEDSAVQYITFSRNFGKEAAIYAGLKNANADLVVLMDADLQHPPQLLIQMFESIEQGYDCAAFKRSSRKGEPWIRAYFAKQFYHFINIISKVEMVDGATDYRMMSRQMVLAILEMPERNRYSKGIFSWIGFNVKWLEGEVPTRAAGQTKWSFYKLLQYAIDGIVAFSTAPLILSTILGLMIFLISLVGIIFIFIKTIIYGDPTSGWPSLAIIVLFIGGLQLFCMGVLGQYMSNTYIETKRRPMYIAKQVIKNESELETNEIS